MKIPKMLNKIFIATVISLAISSLLSSLGRTEAIYSEKKSPKEQSQNSSESEKLDFSGDGRPGRTSAHSAYLPL